MLHSLLRDPKTDKLSMARVLALIWGVAPVLLAVYAAYSKESHTLFLVAEFLAASLTALGLRTRSAP